MGKGKPGFMKSDSVAKKAGKDQKSAMPSKGGKKC